MIIELDHLDDHAGYCVIRDEANRESIVVSGAEIKRRATTSSDFRRYKEREIIALYGYVRVRVNDDCFLGLWLDPWRPELQGGDSRHATPLQVSKVNAEARTVSRRSIAEVLGGCTDLVDLCRTA